MSEAEQGRPDDAELTRLREAVATRGGRTMARSEVLAWNKRWSGSDKQVLVRHLDRVGAARFQRTTDDGYIRCLDASGRTAMVVAPGYLTFPRHWVNDECAPDWPGVALSTLGVRPTPPAAPAKPTRRAAAGARRVEQAPRYCPTCFLQLTTTGVCGNCD